MDTTRALLAALQSAVGEQRVPEPAVQRALAGTADPAVLRRAGRLLAGLEPAGAQVPVPRVAILATATIGAFPDLLRASLVGGGMLPVIEPGDYGTFEMSLATGTFGAGEPPDLVVLLMDESYFLPRDWDIPDAGAIAGHVRARLDAFRDLVAAGLDRTPATVVVHTVPLPGDVADTFISWRDRAQLAQEWSQLNAALLGLAGQHRQVMAIDLAGLLADAPFRARDERMRQYGDIPYTDGTLMILAQQVRRALQAKLGLSRKVLALDLDNTLWGGVVGEVGAAGIELGGLYPGNCYLALQRTVRRLRQQGVILMLASKNDAGVAEAALAGHPEVVLRPELFSVRAVNWSAKTGNMRRAADTLNLPVRSFVLMDDSEFERGLVGAELPDVPVISAAGEPAYLVRSLVRPGWFDVVALTDTDRSRADLYRDRVDRSEFSAAFATPAEYLRALNLELEIAAATEYTVPRLAQLAARTNQFNLTGIRFDEAATAAMSADPGYLVRSLTVTDRFGAEGIVGAIWAERGEQSWHVLNMVLSCRVLARGVEFAAIGWLAQRAAAAGAAVLTGTFVPSGANGVSAQFWPEAGFSGQGDGGFVLDLKAAAIDQPDWIKVTERGDR